MSNGTPPTVDVLLVEDDPRVLSGLHAALDADASMRVVGAFQRGDDALRWLADGGSPGCALVDLGLPDRPGTDVIAALRRLRPDCVVLVFTLFDDDEHLFPALQAGVHGYLLKDLPPHRLVRALRDAVEGDAPMSPSVARRVLQRFQAPPPTDSEPLTPREGELLALLCRGDSYGQAAAHMAVTLSTVQSHVRNLYWKLKVHSKAELVAEAVRRRMFVP